MTEDSRQKDSESPIEPDLNLPTPENPLPIGTNIPFVEFFKLCEKDLPYLWQQRKENHKKHPTVINFEPFTFKD